MSWRTEWRAISDKIHGLLAAGQFFVQFQQPDAYDIINKELLPLAKSISKDIIRFRKTYKSNIPSTALQSVDRFIERHQTYLKISNGFAAVKATLTCLASFRTEFTFQLSDLEAIARRITERAFVHLQRTIVVDTTTKERWKEAFEKGEPKCEKLGALHLLYHGIWAFKACGEKGRTDLILGEPLSDLGQVEATTEALVLTEWKVVRAERELQKNADEAYQQAKDYSGDLLAGIELSSYRYLVLVTERKLRTIPPNRPVGDVIYQFINIAIDPKVPSKM